MELVNLFRALMLYMSNVKPESQSAENISELSESGLTHSPPTLSINSLPVDTDNAFKNDETEYESYQTTALVPYDYDCSIPFLPSFVSAKFPDDVDDDEEELNSDRSGGNEQTNLKQINSKKSDPKQPNSEPSVPKPPDSIHPHAKATFSIPIHVVHKLPDSELNTLHRYFSCYK